MVPATYEIPEGQDSMVVIEEDGLKVTDFTVQHPPIVPDVGYRFDYKVRRISIRGDTIY